RLEPNNVLAYANLAGLLGNLGQHGEARGMPKKGLELKPDFSVHRFPGNAYTTHPGMLAHRHRVIGGLIRTRAPLYDESIVRACVVLVGDDPFVGMPIAARRSASPRRGTGSG